MGLWEKAVQKAQDIVCGKEDPGEQLAREIAEDAKKKREGEK